MISISAVTAIFLGTAQHAQTTTHSMQICANVSSVNRDWCLNHCHAKSFLENSRYSSISHEFSTNMSQDFVISSREKKRFSRSSNQHHKKWRWLWRCKEGTLSSWWHDSMEIFSPLILLCVISLDKFVNKVKLSGSETRRHWFDIMRLDGISLRETVTFPRK